MDECTIPIGVPCMAEAQVGSGHFYFCRVSAQGDAQPGAASAQEVGGLGYQIALPCIPASGQASAR